MRDACDACPFRRSDASPLPDCADAHADGVVAGSVAVCHVNLGPCIGAAMFRANSLCPGRHAHVFDSKEEFLAGRFRA